MEYIKGALAIFFIPFFIGSMLLAAFWEKDAEGVQKEEKPREQGQQSPIPIREVEKQPSLAPREMGGGMTAGGGHSPGNQQTVKRHGDDERRMRKKKRRR
jgi:hypothetical protein